MKVINNEEFKSLVINSKRLVLVDFFATWCGPCRMLAPILEVVQEETKIPVYKVDVDENYELSKEYGIMAVPTMVIFVNGKEVERTSGYMQKNAIEEILQKYVNI